MRSVMVMRAVVCGVVSMAALVGCGETTEGVGSPTASKAAGDIFNPCRGALSDEALRSAGLDPATKLVTTDPPSGASTWRICDWAPTDERYGSGRRMIGVGSTSHTVDEARKKEGVTVIRETTVNSRRGLISKENSTPDICYVSFEAKQGMFEVTAAWLSTEGPRGGDLCEMAEKYAVALEPNLPQ
ncbi:DUF3558 domain-containing protein [Nocardia neocaledoniensis]|uniref:Uncharacterized protein DUF3558 n=1 Tax=Nocardia neocaledoniensis TaxID=236511 RepID=A0A317NR17_9NOCA|nr:DUF3558 domain-containing protein [Nocardia neocaledoniensis]PWV77761.1 uncharacterized protein DUF3558 [Nocardia neocaledoniensis]